MASRSRSVRLSAGGDLRAGFGLDELGGRVAVALHVQIDADLEEAQRGHRADHVDVRQLTQKLHRAIQAELRARRHGEREPHVQLVLAQVVVTHARVRREDRRRLVLALGRHARRDEHAAIAQPARIEDRGDLAYDLLLAQRGHALDHRVLVAADRLGQGRVGPLDERQLGLDAIQQLRVEVVHDPDPSGDGSRRDIHRRSPPRLTVGYSACAPVECFPCFSSSPPSPSERPAASRRRSPVRPSPGRSPWVRAPARRR